MALPRAQRLRRSPQFSEVRAKGTARGGRLMTLAFMKLAPDARTATQQAECGFTLTKKLGNAVHRNFTRRRLREIVGEAFPLLPFGTWIVTIPKKSAVTATFQELRGEWRYLARKLALLPEKPKSHENT